MAVAVAQSVEDMLRRLLDGDPVTTNATETDQSWHVAPVFPGRSLGVNYGRKPPNGTGPDSEPDCCAAVAPRVPSSGPPS
jgi:hypothetical protein